MFIQPEQIRAARAMLDWSQQDLAEAAGVSKDTVKNYELSHNKPNTQTLERITDALDKMGIVFTPGGVQRRRNEVLTLKGREGFHRFYDLVYQEVKESEIKEVCVSNVDERKFMEWASDILDVHSQRMQNIATHFRILIEHGDEYFVATEYAQYRWMSEDHFLSIPYYVFGNKVALILFQEEPVIYILPEREISLAYRKQFDAMWLLSEIPVL